MALAAVTVHDALTASSSSASSSSSTPKVDPLGATRSAFSLRGLSLPDFARIGARSSKELKGAHKGKASFCAWSCDGNWLATCGDETVKVWAPERSTDVRGAKELKGHKQSVAQVRWDARSPHVLASIASDRQLRIWDNRESNASATTSLPANALNVTFHPTESYLALADRDDRVSLLDLRALSTGGTGGTDAAPKPVALIRPPSAREQINDIAWTPDGRRFVLTNNQGTLTVLSARLDMPHDEEVAPGAAPTASADWRTTHSLAAHTGSIFALAMDPCGRFAASGGQDSMIGLWSTPDWTTAPPGMNSAAMKNTILSLAFNGDGEFLAVGGEDPYVEILASSTMTSIHRISIGSGSTPSVAWHPWRHVLAYASDSRSASVHIFGL